ncbi:MAG TPA: cobalamin biosynthesis protein CobD [Thermosulfurimonas dismutans]|uniref:Cobalamin biosynthesis protein CobD n=1 Tax=Thermosulfurimonas dismutans TaxID=999894 RepID=A0A7C3CPB8_9BACT|nr:cobalamin biosynthesis protein CobD [Thermosulfurimonas dismutans]
MNPLPPFATLTLALLLDRLLGDPSFLHPVRWIGLLGNLGFRFLGRAGRRGGLLTLILTAGIFVSLVHFTVRFFPPLEVGWLFYFLALRSLEQEVKEVGRALEERGLSAARQRLSFLVSRRTELLDEQGVLRGALETLSENFNDAFWGPLFWYLAGGIEGAALYKTVEILDSMFGYRYGPYREFGFFIARADDLLNLIPARISALVLALAASLFPGLSGRRALVTALREAHKHVSPNGGWPEGALAGALGVALGGPIPYPGGVQERPWLGPPLREVKIGDIKRSIRLVQAAGLLSWVILGLTEVMLWKFGYPNLIRVFIGWRLSV